MNKAGCLIVLGFVIIGIIASLTSCCANTCGQDAPELSPIPDCTGIYVIEDIIEIPVTPSGK